MREVQTIEPCLNREIAVLHFSRPGLTTRYLPCRYWRAIYWYWRLGCSSLIPRPSKSGGLTNRQWSCETFLACHPCYRIDDLCLFTPSHSSHGRRTKPLASHPRSSY